MTDTIRHGKNQDILDTTAGIAVKGKEGVLLMEAGENMSLTGATFDWKSSIATTIIGREAGLPWTLSEKYGSSGLVKALGKYNAIGIGASGTLDFASDYLNFPT